MIKTKSKHAKRGQEFDKVNAELVGLAHHFEGEKQKMELALSLTPVCSVRTLQRYLAGSGSKFSFAKEVLKKASAFIAKQPKQAA